MKAIKTVKIKRVFANGNVEILNDLVTVEKSFTIEVKGVGTFKLLCTPIDLKALVVGHLRAERIIYHRSQIKKLILKADSAIVYLKKMHVAKCVEKIANSNNIFSEIPSNTIFAIIDKLQQLQKYFPKTGSTHAAAIFNQRGSIITFAEDIARHNALDKAIGKCLLKNIALAGCGVALSSRVSFEMLNKAANIGAELVLSVSAPSSMAVQAARESNITLCSFVRNGRMNVYT